MHKRVNSGGQHLFLLHNLVIRSGLDSFSCRKYIFRSFGIYILLILVLYCIVFCLLAVLCGYC